MKFGRFHSTAKLIDFPRLVNKNLRLRIRNLPDPLPPDWQVYRFPFPTDKNGRPAPPLVSAGNGGGR
jgi:hypothetical protein